MNLGLIRQIFSSGDNFEHIRRVMDAPPGRGRRKVLRVTGLCDGTKPLLCAALAASPRRTVIIVPEDSEAKRLAAFINECGSEAAFYPTRDFNFNNITASHDFDHERLAVLYRLMSEDNFTVVTTPQAALSVTLSPEKLAAYCIDIAADSEIDAAALAEALVAAGYRRTDLVESCGQFAIRGGIVDIYPPSSAPIRVELFGDEVDRLGNFDIDTQRFTGDQTERFTLVPAVENVVTAYDRDIIREAVKKQLRVVKDSAAALTLRAELDALDNDGDINFADKYLPLTSPDALCLADYADEIIVLSENACRERAEAAALLLSQSITDMKESGELGKSGGVWMREFSDIDVASAHIPTLYEDSFVRSGMSEAIDMRSRHVPAYDGNMARLCEDIAAYIAKKTVPIVLCASDAEAASVSAALAEDGFTTASDSAVTAELLAGTKTRLPVIVSVGEYFAGFETDVPRFALLDFSSSARRHSGILRAKKRRKIAGIKKDSTEAIISYADLNVGDYVVHAAYGVGQFMGIENLTVGGVSRDYVLINYAGTDKLYLPTDQLYFVSKYIGASSELNPVKLSKMGGKEWHNAKSRAKTASREMAKELIEIYARRQRTEGIAFDEDGDLSAQFDASFEFEETDGQLSAIEDIRRDMEKGCPMDRLLCGDVGYGKTEVAIRAAFKAVQSGYQVAILVPTTILCLQHYQTLISRMRNFPVTVDMVSRFRTKKEQSLTLRRLKRGEIDIIVGTHRLISEDVEFANLGLLIIDEEQRFGVMQKEKLKKRTVGADVLTLTATPIPRTLNMAMSGILDMSVLEEAPGMRSPVQTYVLEYDEAVILEALRREFRRGGQSFYLINNIESVYHTCARLEKLIPDASIAVAHGQMEREELEEIWAALVGGTIDILVSTTIIETGVDVTNANTLIIENADRYGLSQLHQIRGRVGRGPRRAYAYFTYKANKSLSEIAEHRLAAIKEYAAFGAGFRIALRDLEIRGAGNLLGTEQHGHLDAVGYDMFIKLLSEAVLEEKGEKVKVPAECTVDIKLDAFLSKAYITVGAQRMEMYKKIARISTEADFEDILDELCDRFGEPPRPAVNLCRIALLRGTGIRCGMKKITQIDETLRFVPEEFDPALWQMLAVKLPQAALRASLSPEPGATLRVPKSTSSFAAVDFALNVLEKYAEIRSDANEGNRETK